MGALVRWMDGTFYPDYDRNWDDTLFREEIQRYLREDHVVLDLRGWCRYC
jgi:hypothetical protein